MSADAVAEPEAGLVLHPALTTSQTFLNRNVPVSLMPGTSPITAVYCEKNGVINDAPDGSVHFEASQVAPPVKIKPPPNDDWLIA